MSVAIASSALSRRSRNAYRNSARIRSHGRGVTFHFGSYQYLITVISATSCARPIEVGTNRRHKPMFVIRRPMRSDFFAISVLSGPRPISAAEIHGCGSGIIRRRAARRVRGRARIVGGHPEKRPRCHADCCVERTDSLPTEKPSPCLVDGSKRTDPDFCRLIPFGFLLILKK
jgi:hypothetical protein